LAGHIGTARLRTLRVAIAVATFAILLGLVLPAASSAQGTLTPEGKQDRRALMASLFADKARESDTSWYVYENGGIGERKGRIPALNFAIAAQTVVELYRSDPSFDPNTASIALSSGLENPCDASSPCESEDLASWTLPQGLAAIRKGESAGHVVCEPNCHDAFTPELKERYRRAVSQVGEGMALATPLNSTESLKDGLGDPALEPIALDLLECAEKNPLCLKAANQTFKQWMGVGFDATVAQINTTGFVVGETKTVKTVVDGQTISNQVEVPGLPVKLNPTTGVLVKKDGSPIDKAGMVKAVEAGLAEANGAVAAGTAETKSLLEQKRVLQAGRDKLADAEVKKLVEGAAKREAQIKEAGKLVSLFAQAIKLTGDPKDIKLAEQIATVGNATVEIATGVNDLVTGLVNVGASVATGNVVGAIVGGVGLLTKAMGVANTINGLFGGRTEENAKPEDPVAKQIKVMSGQMTELKKAMNARFDRIEDGLDRVFATTVEGFKVMAARFDQLDQDVADVQAKLVKESYKLDQLERNMRKLGRTTEDRRLWERINTALGYRQRNHALFPIDVFDGHASVFYTHAKPDGHAFDTIALGLDRGALGEPTGPTRDEDVMDRLGPPNPADIPFLDPADPSSMRPAGSQLEENVNYLSSLVATRFGTPAFGAPLPNIRDWALAARAYSRMLIEQPERAPRPPAGQTSDPRLAEIGSVGQGARSQLADLARNATLFTRLLDNHEDRSKDRDGSGRGLYEELRPLEQAFVDRQGLSHASLYGAGREAPPMGGVTMDECQGSAGALSVPSNVSWKSMLEPQFLVAHKRGAGKARVCWEAEYVDVRKGTDCTGTNQCETFGKVRIAAKGQWRSATEPGNYQTLRTLSYTDSAERQICYVEFDPDRKPPRQLVCAEEAWPDALFRWEKGLKASFQSGASAGPDTPGLAESVLAIARKELDGAQVELRAELLNALKRANDASFPPAGLALERLTGAKVIVQSFVNLGLSRALARDERLRGLLYGDDAILDRALVEDEILPNYRRKEDGSLERDEGGNPVRDLSDRDQDPIERLKDQEAERIARLRESISGWQGQLAAGKHTETHPLIDATLAELEMARLVAYSRSECSDGRDNDGDGKIDHGTNPTTDPDCSSRADDFEKAPPLPASTVPPAITGTPRDGELLSASNGQWSGAPTSFAYGWRRCDRNGAACVTIPGALALTYRATAADVGRRLRVIVTARNATGPATATSAPTAIVTARPPRNTALPKATGTARLGRTLTATPGTWTGTAPIGFRYSWLRCKATGLSCTTIPKAAARTYKPVGADLGRRLKVRVSARNAGGAADTLSAPTGAVAR